MPRLCLLMTSLLVMICIVFQSWLPNLHGAEEAKGGITDEELSGFLSILGQHDLYYTACATCHGVKGDGKGPSAYQLNPRPLDFTRGLYKCRSTPWDSLPTDEDMFRTITRGMPGTKMPSWGLLLSEEQRWLLVQYIKTFSKRWEKEEPKAPIVIPDPPHDLGTPESIARGKEIYLTKGGCFTCHGEKGRGDGPIAHGLTDAWGFPIKPRDFTKGIYICGDSEKDIYRTLVTGLNGTPMPSYADSIQNEKERWYLVYYIRSLERKKNLFDYLVKGD